MIIKSLAVGPIQANCYILGCPETKEALIIDPGGDPERIEGQLDRYSLKPVIYLHTHGHLDHVGGTAGLHQSLGGEILIHQADQFLYDNAKQQGIDFGLEIPESEPVDRFITDGEIISWGNLQGKVIHTPGHSPGGICFRISGKLITEGNAPESPTPTGQEETADWVFTGDTLFNGSIGRTDLPGGSYSTLMQSIKDHLLSMPDETVIAPGHGPLSTIGQEKRSNPFVLELLQP